VKTIAQMPDAVIAYLHNQSTASSTWTVVHNMGYRPSVQVVDSGDNIVDAQVQHNSNSQVTISLNVSIAGKAYCS